MTTTPTNWIRNAQPAGEERLFTVDLTPSDFSAAYEEVGGTRIHERQHERFSSSHYQGRQYQAYLNDLFRNEERRGAALCVGSGDGRDMAWLIRHGFAPVVGVDVSAEALRRSKRLLPDGDYSLVHGGLLDLDLAPDSFDLVMAIESMHYLLDEYEEGIGRIAACLKPGGLFVSSEPDWEAGLMYAALRGEFEMLGDLASGRRTYEQIDEVREVRSFQPREKCTLLRKHGLEEVARNGISALPLFLIHLFHQCEAKTDGARASIMEALDDALGRETHFNRLYLTVHRRL